MIVIKAEYGKDIRKVPIPNGDITYDELVPMMRRLFKLQTTDEVEIKYHDEDNDLVSIVDGDDLSFAIQSSRKLKLKIFVNSKTTSVPLDNSKVICDELIDIRNRCNELLDKMDLSNGTKLLSNMGNKSEALVEKMKKRFPAHPISMAINEPKKNDSQVPIGDDKITEKPICGVQSIQGQSDSQSVSQPSVIGQTNPTSLMRPSMLSFIAKPSPQGHKVQPPVASVSSPVMRLLMSLTKAAKYPRVDPPLIAVVEEASPGHRLSTFTINDLSDDALIHIFEYFPLQKIITSFRQVCTRWNATVGTLCASKRSLKLIYYEKPKFIHVMYATLFVRNFASWPPEHYNRLRLKPIGHDNDLIVRPQFKAEHCHLFRRLFPQIQNLLIKETGERFLAHLPALLAGWPGLVTFSLHGYLSPKSAKLQEQLYEALGRLSQLRHLDLLCDRLHGFRANLNVMAPILGQLEHFSARMLNSPLKDTFLGALSANCTSLHFKEFPKVHLLTSYLKPELFQSVTHLGFTKMHLTQEQVNFIGDHFVNCTDLTLEWEDKLIYMQLPLIDIVRPLSKLTRLSVLRLKFYWSKLSDFYEALPDSQPLPSPFSCPSVRQLTIQVDVIVSFEHQVHTRPLYVFLSKAFPNLEDLTVYWTDPYGKMPAHYATEREGQPEVTEYTKNLWRQPLRSFSMEEPTDHFGRFKARFINRNNRP